MSYKPTTVIRSDITNIDFYFPLNALKVNKKGKITKADTSSYSHSLWKKLKKKIKPRTSYDNIKLPFDINDMVVGSFDPGTVSAQIRVEHLYNGECHELYYTENWSMEENKYKYINIYNALMAVDLTNVEVIVIESQINPNMFFVEHMAVGIFVGRGVPCMIVQPRLKSYIFDLPTGDELKPASIEKTIDILTNENDTATLEIYDSLVGDSRVGTEKLCSDITDPALQVRATHVQLCNYCVQIMGAE